jgi:hypothetical protein
MPNIKGGKGYRSGKNEDSKSVLHDICYDEGQSIGQITKLHISLEHYRLKSSG